MLKSEGNCSPVSQNSQSKGEVFGLQEILEDTHLTRDKLISEQESDVELKCLSEQVLSAEETEEVPVCFCKNQDVLM